MFGLWCELIIGKLITMAYNLRLLSVEYEIQEFFVMWTDDPEKMLVVESFDGLELLLLSGFLEWHYVFSMIFGILAICIERIIASMLINKYESSDKPYIPIVLTLCTQLFAITVACGVLFNKINVLTSNIPWIITGIIAIFLFFTIKHVNERWLREMEDPNRKRVFTVSQRFQVRENLRALSLGKRLIVSVLITLIVCGCGIVALIFELIPPFLCHFAENCLFLNPLLICVVTMYSHPSWKEPFKNSFPCLNFFRNEIKLEIATVQPVTEDQRKKLSLETDIYFKQLNNSWV